jgi:N-acetylmuramoyl-L-alanine amidase|tara:strand:- start:215 stop:409 length:195 start_codon:yes stop_codon:yes gene_type:complete
VEARSGEVGEGQVLEWLAEYGYDSADGPQAIAAFQCHFCPETVNGRAGPETLGRLKALLDLCNT